MPDANAAIEAPLTLPAQIEARGKHPFFRDRILLEQNGRVWSYREYRDQCVRYANFIVGRLGSRQEGKPLRVAMLLENHLELLALYGGCGYAGATLFGLNTGLRGDALAGVLNQSGARLLVVDELFVERIQAIESQLDGIDRQNLLILPRVGLADGVKIDPARDFLRCVQLEVPDALAPPDIEVAASDVHMVIYTSGTTGLPKGIVNNHMKLLLIGKAVSGNLELSADDCGYACMPLFHSNAIFLGFQPAFEVGARMVIRERFSASAFVSDVLEHGVTFWNYVGEPVHYILAAIDREFGGDLDRLRREVTENPKNRLNYALGNGAAAPDIDRFIELFAMDDMIEIYGSTEAAISTFRRKEDPRGCVGAINDPAVKILNESGRECPPAEFDDAGKILNYGASVGEICRVAADAALFQGYFENREADQAKFRDGVYRSGDLGHVMQRGEKRYLFFDGRTQDWIRKDGENFSAAQVARLFQEHPDVSLAAAYGVPCSVSDESVMLAIKLRDGVQFDPDKFFAFCRECIDHGGMDSKWFPDFVRVVDEFSYTETQKVLVRELRKQHFDRRVLISDEIYRRTRESVRYEAFGRADFDALYQEFVAREREGLLNLTG